MNGKPLPITIEHTIDHDGMDSFTNLLMVDRWLSQKGRRVSPGNIERPIRGSTRRGHGTRRVKVLGLTPLFGESLSLVHGAGNRLVLVVQVLSLH